LNFHAQQGPVTSGGDAIGSGGSMSFTIGQIDYTSSTSGGGSVNQGIQQPYEIFVVTGIQEKEIELTASVYPNPTTDFVMLSVPKFNNMSYELYDLQGKLIVKQKINSGQTSISMVNLANAIYFIKVLNNKSEVKTFKIIKN
jgi:hypothetical protein